MQRVVGGVRSQQPSPALGDQHGATYAQLERQASSWSVGRVLAASVWLLVVGLLAAIAAVVATRNMHEQSESDSSSSNSFGQLRGLGPHTQVRKDDCKLMAQDVMYWTTAQLEDLHNVTNASDCLKACQLRFFCRAWTWSKNTFVAEDVEVESFAAERLGSDEAGGASPGPGSGEAEDGGVCFLRGLEEDEVPRMLKKSGVVSGIPCHMIWGPKGLTKEEEEEDSATAEPRKNTTTKQVTSTTTTPDPTTTTRTSTTDKRTSTSTTATGTVTTTVKRQFRADDWSPSCGVLDNKTDYNTVLDRGVVKDVGTADYCFHVCEHRTDCDAFTWGKARAVDGLSDHCFLKALGEGEKEVTKRENSKVVSGLSCKHLRSGDVSKRERASLYCWALMLPGSYEEELLAMQHRHSMNIFSCDASAVYSNRSIKIKDAFETRVVPIQLRVPMGGEFMTALNTDVFIAIWKEVIADGVYLKHDWTVKTDPDTVFFASRLQKVLAHHPPAREGVYLNNCWRGMHGPIEVFSVEAVTAWGAGYKRCLEEFNRMCSGPCQWGEDMFIDQCLWRVLGVKRDDAFELLVEDHCDPPKDDSWRSCQDANSVAYHPFKTLAGYKECYSNSAERETHASG